MPGMTPHPSARHDGLGPGRPRTFDEARALSAALDVFWRQGYEATSIDDLTQAMGLSRSSFYGCFGSKHDVLLAAVQSYADASLDKLSAIAREEASPRAAIRRMIRAMVETENTCRGCLLVNCVGELAARDSEVRARIQSHLTQVESLLAGIIARVERPGATECARALVALSIGAITLRKAGLSAGQVDAALTQAEALLPDQ